MISQRVKEVKLMNEKEQVLIEKVAKLPPAMLDQFIYQAEIAAQVVEMYKAAQATEQRPA